MRTARSLRFRLFAYAAIVVAAALLVTGFSLSALFSRHLERRVGQELDTHLNQLVGGLRIDANGVSLFREPVDPRFAAVFGGLYWQVNDLTSQTVLRSRSLWDTYMEIPGDVLSPGETHVHDVEGPQGATLLTHEAMIVLSAPDGDHRLRVAVAIDREDINALAAGFSRDLAPVLGLLGLVLMVGFMVQIGEGLKPVHRVVAGVAAIRTGPGTPSSSCQTTVPRIWTLVRSVSPSTRPRSHSGRVSLRQIGVPGWMAWSSSKFTPLREMS